MTRLLLVCLVLLVGGALIGGFLVVGGPGQARAERDDRDRARHLRELGFYHACTLDQQGGLSKECAGQGRTPDEKDPETGEAYLFRHPDENSFEVCATFRARQSQGEVDYTFRSFRFEGNQGCLLYRREGAGQAWILQ